MTPQLQLLAEVENDLRRLIRNDAAARQALTEAERNHKAQVRRLLLDLLEVTDGFDRVFRAVKAKEDQVTPQMKVWLGNFRTVRRVVDRILAERNVVRIENLDSGFDPEWHKAVEVIDDPARPAGTIVEEIKPGYVWQGEVLRKAEVVAVSDQGNSEDNTKE